MSSHSDAAIPTTTPYLCGGALGCFCDASLAIAADFRAAGTPVARRAGQLILSEGDVAGDLYLLQHGIAKLCHSAASGREHILRLTGPGTILGEPSTHPTRALSVSVEAVTDVRLLHLPRKRVHWLLERRPALALHLLEAFSCELSYARRKTRDLALKDASTRLASLLLGLSRSNRSGEAAPLMRYRRSDLAAMIGVTTETVVRALASLRARRIIASRGRGLAIIDRERLRRLAFKDELDSSGQGGRGVDSDPLVRRPAPASESAVVPGTTSASVSASSSASDTPSLGHGALDMAAFAAAKLLTDALKRVGREARRSSLLDVLRDVRDFETGVSPPIGYGRNRREGLRGALLFQLDSAGKIVASEWIDVATDG